MTEQIIEIEGLASMSRAFRVVDQRLKAELRVALLEAAEPVRKAVEVKAVAGIRNLKEGSPWSKMRTGVNQRLVYIAPVQRGRRTRGHPEIARPNLKILLLDRAMDPAFAEHRQEVVGRVDQMLEHIASAWETTP